MASRSTAPTVVVGGGVGGLCAAASLAARGERVLLLERGPRLGGKVREVTIEGRALDAGPTVLTMRGVFDELFALAGRRLEDYLVLEPAELVARHFFADGSVLDLFTDVERSAAAIAALAGAREADGYRRFAAMTARIYEAVRGPFLESQRPSLAAVGSYGLRGLWRLWQVQPWRPLMRMVERYFQDPRLRQLFGRYATYAGSSPYLAPATLSVIAHVERAGVFYAPGGVYGLARALERLARELGVEIRSAAEVAEIVAPGGTVRGVRLRHGELAEAAAVVLNADSRALACGLFGADARAAASAGGVPSLSAVIWHAVAALGAAPLARHNVFFSADYAREFDDLFRRRRLPGDPTLYVCAQDRADAPYRAGGRERLLVLANAPAGVVTDEQVAELTTRAFARLERDGVRLGEPALATTTPRDLAALFPGTDGALYGPAAHGWRSAFTRPGARTAVRGLYLAGGSVHPGAGVPMAARSGLLAAQAVHADLGARA